MAGAATAPKTARRTAAGRRRAAQGRSAARRSPRAPRPRSRQATPIPGRLVPVAVGRTAGAVASLPDSGVVVRLCRGRLWIAALAALLVGIVALNVVSLSLSSSTSETARAVEELEQQGSALQAQLARELSSRRVQSTAGALGLIVPEPGSIRYLRPSPGDAAEAARRLRSGELVAAPALAPVETEALAIPEAPQPATEEPAPAPAPEAAEPAPAPEPEPAPAPAPEPASPAAGGGSSGGGVAPP